jgi:prepilin-type N-terminal cleavage/methylation domain-containing protein/prepilin-type processing-associated H-X9-DG protein
MPRRSDATIPARPGRGFTLIELLVVIAIIAILASIIFPVYAKTRQQARSAACLSNLKQLMMAVKMYVQDADDRLPAGTTPDMVIAGESEQLWAYIPVVLYPYTKSMEIAHCPSDSRGVYPYSYMYCFCCYSNTGQVNQGLNPCDIEIHMLSEIEYPSSKVFLFENSYFHDPPATSWFDTRRGTARLNVAFADGHVKSVFPSQGNRTNSPLAIPPGACDFNYTLGGVRGRDFD